MTSHPFSGAVTRRKEETERSVKDVMDEIEERRQNYQKGQNVDGEPDMNEYGAISLLD